MDDAAPPPRPDPAPREAGPQEFDRLYSANLLRQLMDVSQGLNRRLRERSADLGHHGLKMSFATVMAHAGFESARLSDIAALNGLSKQAISQIARELVDLGYIQLAPDPNDARARIIALTPHGHRLISDALRSIDDLRSEAAAIVGADRFAVFEAVTAELWSCFGRRAVSGG